MKHGHELYNEAKQRAAQRGRAPSQDQKRREQEALRQYA